LPAKAKPTRRKNTSLRDPDAVDPRYIVPGLARGLALLQLFTRRKPAQTLAELAAGLGLSRSAAYRLVYTLEKEVFIAREPHGRHYRLTAKVLGLGFDYLNARAIPEIAEPVLRSLSDTTSAAAYVVTLDGWHAVYMARVVPAAALVSNLPVGARLPAHVTASGRVLLACQDPERLRDIYKLFKRDCRVVAPPASLEQLLVQAAQDKKRGYVYHRSILNPGVVSCACPVRDKTGAATTAITVIGPEQLMTALGGEKAIKPRIIDAAMAISRKLGYVAR
jgi:IclR family pca regulon transcriptional regulator